ncbi:hypothetical protein E2C01_070565 [Portunus trituberculatus]|uniref:Uncharacterized protein n=1 Tax=Portunus trituberculatus TaxID=210409 RepID=A0A5B7I2M6_PORTR|nr:hypothetical protein [Portunus trituberculatus]
MSEQHTSSSLSPTSLSPHPLTLIPSPPLLSTQKRQAGEARRRANPYHHLSFISREYRFILKPARPSLPWHLTRRLASPLDARLSYPYPSLYLTIRSSRFSWAFGAE